MNNKQLFEEACSKFESWKKIKIWSPDDAHFAFVDLNRAWLDAENYKRSLNGHVIDPIDKNHPIYACRKLQDKILKLEDKIHKYLREFLNT